MGLVSSPSLAGVLVSSVKISAQLQRYSSISVFTQSLPCISSGLTSLTSTTPTSSSLAQGHFHNFQGHYFHPQSLTSLILYNTALRNVGAFLCIRLLQVTNHLAALLEAFTSLQLVKDALRRKKKGIFGLGLRLLQDGSMKKVTLHSSGQQSSAGCQNTLLLQVVIFGMTILFLKIFLKRPESY